MVDNVQDDMYMNDDDNYSDDDSENRTDNNYFDDDADDFPENIDDNLDDSVIPPNVLNAIPTEDLLERFMRAAEAGDVETLKPMLTDEMLLDHYALKQENRNPLHYVAEYCSGVGVKTVCQCGVDLNAKDTEGNTALHVAVENNKLAAVQALINAGVNLNPRNFNQYTPLTLAAEAGNIPGVELLIAAGADVNYKKSYDKTPLYVATSAGNTPVMELLIGAEAQVNESDGLAKTLLGVAAAAGNVPAMKVLMAAGADPNKASGRSGNTPLHDAVRAGQVDAVVTLLEAGVNVNPLNADGQTPLHCSPNRDTVLKLTKAGANVNAQDSYGNTPLHSATMNGNVEVACALQYECGAQIGIPNRDGWTTDKMGSLYPPQPKTGVQLPQLEDLEETAKLLKKTVTKAGINPKRLDAVIAAELVDNVLNPHDDCSTVFHHAAFRADLAAVDKLLKAGAGFYQNAGGNTPLHYTRDQKVREKILQHYPDGVNIQNNDGNTALHFAAAGNDPDAADMLLKAGANPLICNSKGKNAGNMAKERGCEKALEVINSFTATQNSAQPSIDVVKATEVPTNDVVAPNTDAMMNPAVKEAINDVRAATGKTDRLHPQYMAETKASAARNKRPGENLENQAKRSKVVPPSESLMRPTIAFSAKVRNDPSMGR